MALAVLCCHLTLHHMHVLTAIPIPSQFHLINYHQLPILEEVEATTSDSIL